MKNSLSPVYWLWLPVIGIGLQILLEIFAAEDILAAAHAENGPHETLQALLMVCGFFFSIYALIRAKDILLKAWFGLAAICCFYVAGEEVSWGQHIIDWATPEYWGQINDQNETNLHNTSSWFDQKPRLILEVGIIFGGLVAPFLKKRGLLKLPPKLDQLLPSPKLGVIALLILVPKIIEKTFEIFDIVVFARVSEVQELYMFYFVLIYLIMLHSNTSKNRIP